MNQRIVDIIAGIAGTVIVLLCGVSFDSVFKENLLGVLSIPLERKITWDKTKFKEELSQEDGGQLIIIKNDNNIKQNVSCKINKIEFQYALGNNVDKSYKVLGTLDDNGSNEINNFQINSLQVASSSNLPLFLRANMKKGLHNPRIMLKEKPIPEATLISRAQLFIFLLAAFFSGMLVFHLLHITYTFIANPTQRKTKNNSEQ